MRSLLLVFLLACGGNQSTPATPPTGVSAEPAPPAGGACVKSGCSGTVCTEPGNEMVTTCEMKAEYACYQSATCERQTDGACGWTQTPELTACVANPPAL